MKFLDTETLRELSNHSRNRIELIFLKKWLELLQTPGLGVATCKFLISNIVQISDNLGEECSDVFFQCTLNLNNRYFLENMVNSGPNLEKVDHTLRDGKHSAFLNVYNRTVVKKESRFSRTLTGISDYKVTFLLFLNLCTQVFGAAANDNF